MTRAEDGVIAVVFDGFADWELALALAELRRAGGRRVIVVGLDGDADVVSMGGVRVRPDAGFAALAPTDGAILLLPGGDRWLAEPPDRIASAVAARLEHGGVVGAICGATVPLARAGLFAERRHTSNDRGWLLGVAGAYAGAERYADHALAVRDGGLVTASGTGSVAFAAELLAAAGVFSAAKRGVWRHLYQTGAFPPDADVAAFFAES